jgi:pimeloyl-ACP methyl ester carboxylesterase
MLPRRERHPEETIMHRTSASASLSRSNPPVRGFSRRTLLGAASAVGFAVAAGIGRPTVGAARTSMATTAPTAPQGFTGTPMRDQLAWFLAGVNSGGTTLTEADIAAHVASPLLAVVPPAQLIGLVQELAAGYGAMTLQGTTRPPTATQAVGLVSAAVGLQLALPIAIEAAAPHRITGLNVYPCPPGDGKPLLPITLGGGAETHAPLVDVGGRGLYRADVGSGGPTVVLEAGLTDSAAPWSGVIPALASFTRVVSYDRPNTAAGASDSAPMPRTAADVVADLHALLNAAAAPSPYVLVGHSVGGLFVRLYASRYPDEIAGLVLVDTSHEDQDARRQAMVSADLFAAEQQFLQSSDTEGIDLDASFGQVREARAAAPLRPMPLIVLSAGQSEPATYPAGWRREKESRLHNELQTDVAGLVPGGRHVVAEHSGHYIQQSQPDLVVAAIRDVVQAARNPGSWSTSTS